MQEQQEQAESGLLRGESPESEDPEEIRHWLSVYEELNSFVSASMLEGGLGSAVQSRVQAIRDRYRYWSRQAWRLGEAGTGNGVRPARWGNGLSRKG